MKQILCSITLLAMLFLVPGGAAQCGAESATREWQVWTSGGRGLNGSASNTGVWTIGARYGWILTGPAGPGLLRGQFEYAVDAVPAFLVLQKHGTAYGAGLNPFALKWNFVPRRRVAPYLDLEGGTLFTNRKVPPGTSRVNFTSSGALGLRFLRARFDWSVELRFMHISNAGLSTPNPGVNTVQFRLGFGRFLHPR